MSLFKLMCQELIEDKGSAKILYDGLIKMWIDDDSLCMHAEGVAFQYFILSLADHVVIEVPKVPGGVFLFRKEITQLDDEEFIEVMDDMIINMAADSKRLEIKSFTVKNPNGVIVRGVPLMRPIYIK